MKDGSSFLELRKHIIENQGNISPSEFVVLLFKFGGVVINPVLVLTWWCSENVECFDKYLININSNH